jgi:hypothetical protein
MSNAIFNPMTMKSYSGAALLILQIFSCSSAMSQAESRIFTDNQGRKLEGEISAVAVGQVQIKRIPDGKLFALPIAQLSAEDQKVIAEYAANNAKFNFEVKYAKTKLGEKKSKSGDVAYEEEKWAYKVALRNLSSLDADDVRIDYWLFRRIDEGKGKSSPRVDTSGSVKSAQIKKAATYDFVTESVTLTKSTLDAGYYYTDGKKSKSADSVGGLAIRIFKGTKEVYAFASDKDLLTAAQGSAMRRSTVDE